MNTSFSKNLVMTNVSGKLKVAVLIPCHNEALPIGQVVSDFRVALPGSPIYVFDNNSTDDTINVARNAGAIVRRVPLQGKGNVVRRMFGDIEADAYILVDGDGTYHAPSSVEMVEKLFAENLDMVVACRVSAEQEAYRRGHQWGNRLFSAVVARIFGRRCIDLLSGYRVFSRRFVKSFPAMASGFETETELTIHALELRMPMAEIDTPYRSRLEGSASKLNTYRDGVRITVAILRLFMLEKPLVFFGLIGIGLGSLSVLLSVPILIYYFETGLVPRLPTAVLSTGLMLLAFFSMFSGLILDSVARGRKEAKLLWYLSHKGPSE
jgi:glycosyltransferase involved in cell wall biosynthesis